MLIQLTIKNFKSVRNEQIIDFYSPVSRDERAENTFLLPESKIRVLRSIGLYGANAAGKSTLFDALSAIIRIILDDGFKPDADISAYNPYRLDELSRHSPTLLSLEFALPFEGILPYRRFLYEISFDRHHFVKERLSAYPAKGRRLVLFSRGAKDTYKTIRIRPELLKESGRRIPFFRNQSFLSAAWKTADAPNVFRVVASYLCGEFRLAKYRKGGELHSMDRGKLAAALLPYADFGIKTVIERRRKIDPDRIAAMQKYLSKEDFEAALERMQKTNDEIDYEFSHVADAKGGRASWIRLDEESDGTRAFFSFLPRVLDNLDNGFTMLDDEIDTSMHPFLVEFIIRLFNDPEVNVNNAQLLFSTHNLALLSESLLRKDQIWFAEKRDGVSEYFSLQDFDDKKVHPDSPFAAWYTEGRFGGVPKIDYAGFVKAVKKLRKEVEDA